jgi:hypothetical protein
MTYRGQDYGGFPSVPNDKLRQWAAQIEGAAPAR